MDKTRGATPAVIRCYSRLFVAVVFGLAFCLPPAAVACSTRTIAIDHQRIMVPVDSIGGLEKESYFVDLLQRVLDLTEEEYGPCSIGFSARPMTRMRSTALINNSDGIDLFWATTSIQRETILRPIRIPILKGLMSHKILLIRPDTQEAYSGVRSLTDLQQFRAGVGADWPDASILRSNGIRVETSTHYAALGRMLAAHRFDFFPRGANEVLLEMTTLQDMPIAVEQDLVIIYPAPVYFFVNIENMKLAKRLEQGLSMMVEDGSFAEFFYSHPAIEQALSELQLSKRRSIYLHNPLLPLSAPLDVDKYWLYPWGKLRNP